MQYARVNYVNVIESVRGLKGAGKYMLIYLILSANRKGSIRRKQVVRAGDVCRSVRRMAKDTGYANSTVVSLLKELQDRGVIEASSPWGSGAMTVYSVLDYRKYVDTNTKEGVKNEG